MDPDKKSLPAQLQNYHGFLNGRMEKWLLWSPQNGSPPWNQLLLVAVGCCWLLLVANDTIIRLRCNEPALDCSTDCFGPC